MTSEKSLYSFKDLAPSAGSFFVTIAAAGMATFASKRSNHAQSDLPQHHPLSE